MLDLVMALRQVLHRSALSDLKEQFGGHPKGAGWHVISDYVLDNPDKHDTASFVILLHHDKLDTIVNYIQAVAPSDLKECRTASDGMIRYLNSPVAFSFNFVLDEDSAFLKEYATRANMIAQLEEFQQFTSFLEEGSPASSYFADARKRVRSFAHDLRQKGNEKLARKVFIVAAYAVAVFECLDIVAKPQAVSWISDRDAMTDQHDGVIFEVATLLFFALQAVRRAEEEPASEAMMLDRPRFTHVMQEKAGDNYLDPMIRMADYMAGTVSDMNLHHWDFSRNKFRQVAEACFVNSRNHVLAQVIWERGGFTVRRIAATP